MRFAHILHEGKRLAQTLLAVNIHDSLVDDDLIATEGDAISLGWNICIKCTFEYQYYLVDDVSYYRLYYSFS